MFFHKEQGQNPFETKKQTNKKTKRRRKVSFQCLAKTYAADFRSWTWWIFNRQKVLLLKSGISVSGPIWAYLCPDAEPPVVSKSLRPTKNSYLDSSRILTSRQPHWVISRRIKHSQKPGYNEINIAQPKTDQWLSSPSHFSSFFTV